MVHVAEFLSAHAIVSFTTLIAHLGWLLLYNFQLMPIHLQNTVAVPSSLPHSARQCISWAQR